MDKPLLLVVVCLSAGWVGCSRPRPTLNTTGGRSQPTQPAGTARNEIERRSDLWKASRSPADFVWLAEHGLPNRSTGEHVSELFGAALHKVALTDGGEYWLYVWSDPAKQQFEAIAVIFDRNGSVVGLGRKPIE